MSSVAGIGRLLTRLLLGIAVIGCVLGLAEAGAVAAAGTPPAAVVAPTSVGHHDTAHAGSADAATADAGQAQRDAHSSERHAGHGPGGHVVGCMAATGMGFVAFVMAPLAEDIVTAAEPSATAGYSSVPVAQPPRPPDLTTLCVQRV